MIAPPAIAGLRAESGPVVRLATPVVLVQLGMMSMGTVDTMMLGRVSELALAAGALGASISFGLMVFAIGVLMGLDPLIAQAFGAGDHQGIAIHYRRGLVLALLLSIPLGMIMWDTRPLLRLLGQQPAVIEHSAGYMRAIVPGLPAFLLYAATRRTIQAMSILMPALTAIIVANLVNAFANWILIFGHLGAPPLGVTGSGYATSISRWVMLITLMIVVRGVLGRYWREFARRRFRPSGLLQPLRIGLPIGIQTSLEMWMFMAVALMMGHLGARELAGHQIALNLAAIAFMLPLGVSGAASTRVGNAIGRRDMTGARRAAVVCLVLGGGVMTVSALAFWLIPGPLSRLYTPDAAVIRMAVALLPIAALFQVFDGLQVVGSGVLRGAADTRAPAILALIGFWGLGLPLAYVLGLRTELGPRGMWWGLTLGLSSVAVLILIRIVRRFSGEIEAVEVARSPAAARRPVGGS